MPTAVTQYRCNRCSELYPTNAEAQECEADHAAFITLMKEAVADNSVQLTWSRGLAAPTGIKFISGDKSIVFLRSR